MRSISLLLSPGNVKLIKAKWMLSLPSANAKPAVPLWKDAALRSPDLLLNPRGHLLSAHSGPLRHDPRQEKGA